MLKADRRTTLKLLGGAALAVPALATLSRPAAAQEDLYVGSTYQNFKRGTIHSLAPQTRGFVVKQRLQRNRADPGTVLGSDPGRGDSIDEGSTVTLIVSSGPGEVQVEDVLGELAAAGLVTSDGYPALRTFFAGTRQTRRRGFWPACRRAMLAAPGWLRRSIPSPAGAA